MKRKRTYSHYFKLYKQIKKELDGLVIARGGSFGIAAKPIKKGDWAAERYQQIRMRLELVEAHLEDRNPNWYHCYYLPNQEMQRRNEYYLA